MAPDITDSEEKPPVVVESSKKPDSMVERERHPFLLEDTETKILELPEYIEPSPVDRHDSPPSRSPVMRQRERVQLFALFFAIFVAGWDGGTYGPLIPRFQTYYDVRETRDDLAFVSDESFSGQLHHRVHDLYFQLYCTSSLENFGENNLRAFQGFISGATANVYLTDKLGFGKVCARLFVQAIGTHTIIRLSFLVRRIPIPFHDIALQSFQDPLRK